MEEEELKEKIYFLEQENKLMKKYIESMNNFKFYIWIFSFVFVVIYTYLFSGVDK